MLTQVIALLVVVWVLAGFASGMLAMDDRFTERNRGRYIGDPVPIQIELGVLLLHLAGGPIALFCYSMPYRAPRYRLVVLDYGARAHRLGRHRKSDGAYEKAKAIMDRLQTDNCMVQLRRRWHWESTGLNQDHFRWLERYKEEQAPLSA